MQLANISDPLDFAREYSDLVYKLKFYGIITEEAYFFLRESDPHDMVTPETMVLNTTHAIGVILSYALYNNEEL
jgi:hypothetical protein